METYGAIIIELSIGLFGLLLLTKLLGRASMSEATPFDFISLIVVGDFVSEAIYDPKTSISKIIFAIMFWGVLIYLIDWITLKFNSSRRFFESEPALVIRNGWIDRQVLKKNRVDMNHLQMLLRDREIFSIREIDYAILEPNGKISVIRKPEYDLPKRREMPISLPKISLPTTFISDGVVLEKNLKDSGRSFEWLIQELKEQAIERPEEVLIAEWRKEDGLYVQKKHRQRSSHKK
ncbi:MAG: DUF421 domain-containing protein [Sporolactobacillus sp.]